MDYVHTADLEDVSNVNEHGIGTEKTRVVSTYVILLLE